VLQEFPVWTSFTDVELQWATEAACTSSHVAWITGLASTVESMFYRHVGIPNPMTSCHLPRGNARVSVLVSMQEDVCSVTTVSIRAGTCTAER
jgi:hypothetical protein